MGLVLKKEDIKIKTDSNCIIGVMGNYKEFLRSLRKYQDDWSLVQVSDILLRHFNEEKHVESFEKMAKAVLHEFDLSEEFLQKKINDLSNGEKKILEYLILLMENKRVMVINEPFRDLDYFWKKKIIILLKKIIKETNKTIFIGSNQSDVIYSICNKILLIKNKKWVYDDINNVFGNNEILNDFGIEEPLIVKFIRLAKEKNVNLEYTNDIRDLIKEVYKNVEEE